MVNKRQKLAEKRAVPPGDLLDSQLAQTVKDSAQQIWLAGLGAFAKAQDEGSKVFDALIQEGLGLQRKTQHEAGDQRGHVADRMAAMVGQVGHQANAQWDKLESIFEERTARALGRLGVPNAADVAALSARLDALADAVAKLSGPAAGEPAPHPPGAKRGRVAKSASTAAVAVKRKTAARKPVG